MSIHARSATRRYQVCWNGGLYNVEVAIGGNCVVQTSVLLSRCLNYRIESENRIGDMCCKLCFYDIEDTH
jgi:hypothetical protein